MRYPITLIIHGGAGDVPIGTHGARIQGCRRAAEAGWAVLARGRSALDAIEAAVRVLEDDPVFDAGYGSFLNAAGRVEMDAIIMDGRDLNFGAVAVVQRVRHPVTLARLVMTESEHAMLVGAGAEAFARQHGLPICPTGELLAEGELERWRAAQGDDNPRARETESSPKDLVPWPSDIGPSDTVGAVALDVDGNLAAATSTGGTFNRLPGRVGDSSLVGCGAYADNRTAAVSATGLGEALMKVVISKAASDFLAHGMDAQAAADAAIALLAERTTGHGGLVLLDRLGRVGMAHNTPHMAYAVVTAGGEIVTGIRYPATSPSRRAGEGPQEE